MKADRGFWLSLVTGAAAFFVLADWTILDPHNAGWLLSHPDTATSYLGWQFFRQAPLAQLPLGANPAYGMEIATSVVFSDSIPLLALLLKPFSAFLPATFQYLGLWLLACCVLQSVFAYRLLRRFSPDEWLCWIGAGFFLVAPVWIYRLTGHYALAAQWVVLAALCLYFAPQFSPRRWIALLCAAALIHFYLLVMAGALWLADLWQRRASLLRHFLPAAALTLAAMWLAGYFTIGTSASAIPGFGTYRMNLLSPVDANVLWSRLLPDLPSAYGEFEGLAYLGLGILLLVPLAAYQLRKTPFDRKRMVPLLAAGLVLTLLAASNRVALGRIELFSYDLPDLLRPYGDLLRASGRLFWPVYYLACATILVLAARALPRRAAIAVCAIVLGVQVADSSVGLRRTSERLADRPWHSPLRSPLWAEAADRYRRVLYVLPRNDHATFLPWAAFAADHRMAVNFGYFARADAEKMIEASQALETAVRANALDPGNLYVFENEPLWRLASARRGAEDFVGEVDGYRVIAPGLRGASAGSPARSAGSLPAGARTR